MNDNEALALIRRILSDRLGVDAQTVVPDAHLRDDLDLDSLDAIDLVDSLQDEIGQQFEASVIAGVQTVADIAGLLRLRSVAP